jgi:hypothetical protein
METMPMTTHSNASIALDRGCAPKISSEERKDMVPSSARERHLTPNA